jgi:hypothetical protein
MADTGATPKEYGLKVQSHPILMVTSPLKMRTAKNLLLSFSGELLETVAYFTDKMRLDANLDATNRLIASLGEPEANPSRIRGGVAQPLNGFLWRGVTSENVADFFDAYQTNPAARKVNSKMLSEFVRSMASSSHELTSWTVALVGGGTGEPFTFERGLKMDGMLKRKANPNPDLQKRYSIGRLLSPDDEAIDLDDVAWQAALEATRRAWKPDPARQKDDALPKLPEIPNGPSIRRIRGKGAEGVPPSPERGLLLLYALDPKQAEHEILAKRSDPVVGFGVSFPSSDSGVKVEYKVDHLLWEQEYGSAE